MTKIKKERLWTKEFILVWQGQFVSTLGDAAYSIALGFWVLHVTGSTALMGTLMAVSALPGILISPYAGIWIDRLNKKTLLVSMDVIRGIIMLLIAFAAFEHSLAIWMLFTAGILISICGAVFRPGINTAIPEIVRKSRLSNANSMISAASSCSNMLGNVAGGFLFQLFGAPLLFLFNGLSYLFSGGSLSFVKMSKGRENNRKDIWEDMRQGYQFMWAQTGLRYLLIIAAIMNFFSFAAIVLFLPLFQKTPYLGAGRYGIAMACFMGGAMVGFLFSSIITIPPQKRAKFFILSNTIMCISFVSAVNQHLFGFMIPSLLLGGFFNSIVNVILLSAIQLTTPNEMRGKVLAFMNMITQSLTPFAMALGGVLASILSIRLIISVCFIIILLFVLPFIFLKSFTQFISYDN